MCGGGPGLIIPMVLYNGISSRGSISSSSMHEQVVPSMTGGHHSSEQGPPSAAARSVGDGK